MYLIPALLASALALTLPNVPRDHAQSPYRCVEPVALDPSWTLRDPGPDGRDIADYGSPRARQSRLRPLAESEVAPGLSADLFHVSYGGGWGSDLAVGGTLVLPF